jgi:Flp pilus assembly protein TadG
MIIKQQLKLLRKFLNSQNASIAFISALSFVPIMLFVGSAVDYSRVSDVKAKMQVVSDGAALAAANANSREEAQAEVNRITQAHASDLKNTNIYPSHLKSWCLKYFEVIG